MSRRAVAPKAEERREICGIDNRVAVEITRRAWNFPIGKQHREVWRIDHAVSVDITEAIAAAATATRRKLDHGKVHEATACLLNVVPLPVGTEQLCIVFDGTGVVRFACVPVGVLRGTAVSPVPRAFGAEICEADPEPSIDTVEVAEV